MWIKNNAMPVPRNDIAPNLQLRRAPVLPAALRQPKSRVLQVRHSPQQLSLFPMRTTQQIRPALPESEAESD